MKLVYSTRKLRCPNKATATDASHSATAINPRARALPDHEGKNVCNTVIDDNAPQYRFIALAAAIPRESTITTSPLMPCVRPVRPFTTFPSATERPMTVPSTMGNIDPSEHPQ